MRIRAGNVLIQNVCLWFYGPSSSKTSESHFTWGWLHGAVIFHLMWMQRASLLHTHSGSTWSAFYALWHWIFDSATEPRKLRRVSTWPTPAPAVEREQKSQSQSGDSLHEKPERLWRMARVTDRQDMGPSTGLNWCIWGTKTYGLYSPALSLTRAHNEHKGRNSTKTWEVTQKAANLVCPPSSIM